MTKSMQSIIHAQIISGLKTNDNYRFKVIGNCMWPLIQKGDWVIIDPRAKGLAIQPGEIVLINRGDDFVVHRLIRCKNSEFFTQGDRSKLPDSPVQIDQILGCVISIEKKCVRFQLNHPLMHFINRSLYFISSLNKKFF